MCNWKTRWRQISVLISSILVFFVKKMPLLHLLLHCLSSTATLCTCLPLVRFNMNRLTRTERSMKAADNCFSILLKALLPFRWVFSSYFLSALLVLTWRLSPQVHSHWPLGLRNLSYSVLYKCVHLRLTAYLAHDFVCPGAGASWRFCFLFPYSLVPASLKSPRPFAANDLSREF